MIKREFERKFILKENNKLLDKEFIEHTFDNVSKYKKIFNAHAVNINQGYIKEQYAKQLLYGIKPAVILYIMLLSGNVAERHLFVTAFVNMKS